ncbi:MAG TPA: hypothetical protein ENN05_11790 [Deltaproteobacteria bacterium]|nr:hypothetical protein [Deltaproteobacteria bacterium]
MGKKKTDGKSVSNTPLPGHFNYSNPMIAIVTVMRSPVAFLRGIACLNISQKGVVSCMIPVLNRYPGFLDTKRLFSITYSRTS